MDKVSPMDKARTAKVRPMDRVRPTLAVRTVKLSPMDKVRTAKLSPMEARVLPRLLTTRSLRNRIKGLKRTDTGGETEAVIRRNLRAVKALSST